MSSDRRQTPRRASDIWQVALVQVLGERVLSAPANILELLGRMGITLIISTIFCAGLLYWKYPELINRSLYKENPIEFQLRRLPENKKQILNDSVKHLYKKSEADWVAVFDWRTLKEVNPIITYGSVPSAYKMLHFLPQEWKRAMPDLIYEACSIWTQQKHVAICPILGDEDIWGFIVVYGFKEAKLQEILLELRFVASRWSDYLY